MPNNTPQQQLISAILASTNDKQLQQALLVGATGESNMNPQSHGGWYNGSPTGGAFGFTDPSFPYADRAGTSSAAQQVADILPAYQAAQQQLPSTITNPQAQAEWIAIAAERPLYDTTEMSQIQNTNAPAEYGANSSYYAGNWQQITQITSGTPGNYMTTGSLTASAASGASAVSPTDQSTTGTGTGVLGNCNSGNKLIKLGLLGNFFSECQAKAIVSGLLVASGALVMVVAVGLLFAGNSSVAKAVGAIGLADVATKRINSQTGNASNNSFASGFLAGQNESRRLRGEGTIGNNPFPKGASAPPGEVNDFDE